MPDAAGATTLPLPPPLAKRPGTTSGSNQMADRTPTHAFGIETASAMLAKLQRELDRLAKTTSDAQAVVDHSINCAWTAFHLADWVWQLHFRRNSSAQQALAKKAGTPEAEVTGDSPFVPSWMKKALFALCPEIGLCEGLAIGSKHVFPEITPTKVVEAFVSARSQRPFVLGHSTLGGGDVLGPVDPSKTQYLPKVRDEDGNVREAIQVFDAAVLFWQRFLKEFGIQ